MSKTHRLTKEEVVDHLLDDQTINEFLSAWAFSNLNSIGSKSVDGALLGELRMRLEHYQTLVVESEEEERE